MDSARKQEGLANEGAPSNLTSTENSASPKEPTLIIGSKAPSLEIEHWISDGRGEFTPVTTFEKDKVYVVEFWATWCGPCVASMPHLAETQIKYADQNVQLISISNEDLATIDAFLDREVAGGQPNPPEPDEGTDDLALEDNEPTTTYRDLTAAYCLTTDEDRSVYEDYMDAANQNGIPTCFIVGKTGMIEWIGHPMRMDEPLSKIVDDAWDSKSYAEEFNQSQARNAIMASVMQEVRLGNSEAAFKLIAEEKAKAKGDLEMIESLDELSFRLKISPIMAKAQEGQFEDSLQMLNELETDIAAAQKPQLNAMRLQLLLQTGDFERSAELVREGTFEPQVLNAAAWNIYMQAKEDSEYAEESLPYAISFAEKAIADDPDSGSILDTLAHLHHLQGDLSRAIEIQTQALENAGPMKDQIQAFLDLLKEERDESVTEAT